MGDTDPTGVAAGAGASGTEAAAVDGESSRAADRAHLDDVADGCGCAEVWEHLSEERGTEGSGGGTEDVGAANATGGG